MFCHSEGIILLLFLLIRYFQKIYDNKLTRGQGRMFVWAGPGCSPPWFFGGKILPLKIKRIHRFPCVRLSLLVENYCVLWVCFSMGVCNWRGFQLHRARFLLLQFFLWFFIMFQLSIFLILGNSLNSFNSFDFLVSIINKIICHLYTIRFS